MHANLNHPRLDDGAPLTAADLADYIKQRNATAWGCSGDCNQGRSACDCWPAEACTEIGADALRGDGDMTGLGLALCAASAVGMAALAWHYLPALPDLLWRALLVMRSLA